MALETRGERARWPHDGSVARAREAWIDGPLIAIDPMTRYVGNVILAETTSGL